MSWNFNKQFLNSFITLTQNFSSFYCTDFKKKSNASIDSIENFLKAQTMIKNYFAFSRINFHYSDFIKKLKQQCKCHSTLFNCKTWQRCITRNALGGEQEKIQKITKYWLWQKKRINPKTISIRKFNLKWKYLKNSALSCYFPHSKCASWYPK